MGEMVSDLVLVDVFFSFVVQMASLILVEPHQLDSLMTTVESCQSVTKKKGKIYCEK